MPPKTSAALDVFSVSEIADAAGVSSSDVGDLIATGELRTIDGRFARPDDAVRVVRALRLVRTASGSREIFSPRVPARRSPGRALAASGAIHAALLAGLMLVSMLGISSTTRALPKLESMRLVFLPLKGPGGGGGGGGLKQPTPPAPAKLKGASAVRSPVPPRRPLTSRPPEPKPTPPPPPPPPEPTPRPVDPPPVAKPVVVPQVVAPVATLPADTDNRAGVMSAPPAPVESAGPGTGGGAGTGTGTGLGEGNGSGIGPGTGGGTGGGPYRPGNGITPPSLLREVKPDYTEDARRRGVAGDVVLEIVVRYDGSVGNVRLVQGLDSGLDRRAIDAVRAWKFAPAKRYGTPVDVLVEVAVEFKLR
jgi:protein TonB